MPHDPRPIIYIAGRSFVPGYDGQARRLQLLTRCLGDLYCRQPKFLLAPVLPAPQDFLVKEGWKWLPIDQKADRTVGSRLAKLLRFFSWRWLGLGRGDILAFICGSRVFAGPRTMSALALPNAIVVVGRCEFAGLVRLRRPGQTWILDSNDSVWSLASTYHLSDHYRSLVGSSLTSWLDLLRRDEMAWAKQFDRIVCIAKEDLDYYAEAKPGACVLEDTDILVPDGYVRKVSEFDVGFVGGTHVGSRISAEELLRLACRPGMEQLRFAVAGGVCKLLATRDLPRNVVLLGKVEDSLDFLSRCRCSVIITGQETGASVKFQEALAAGCIVIANRLAARHSLAVPGETYIEASSIDAVAEIFREGTDVSFKAPDFRVHFSYEAFKERLSSALTVDSDNKSPLAPSV